MKKIVVLTGAGISAESGVMTFRGNGGLWEKYDISEVASIQGWEKDPELVLEFYNLRRRQLKEVEPNDAHRALVALERDYEVTIITQNVDDLHERGGSARILHLHGELRKVRSTKDEKLVYWCEKDLVIGDLCEKGSQLRPHIVWFGEPVPLIYTAADLVADADIVLIIGTSMQVYPAASLVGFAKPEAQVYYIDPDPTFNEELEQTLDLEVIAEAASSGVPKLVNRLLAHPG